MQAIVATPERIGELMAVVTAYVNRTLSPDLFLLLDELDLSLTQMKALHVLDMRDETSVGGLAAEVALSLPAMSRAIDGLVGRGYVERRDCTADRRSRLVALLPAGRAVVERLYEVRSAALQTFAEGLSEQERELLARALGPIAERIRLG